MYSARVGAGYATLDCFRTSGALTARYLSFGRVDFTGRVSKIGIGEPLDWSRALCQGARNDPYSDRLNYYAGVTLSQGAIPGLRALFTTFTVFSERRSEYKAYLRSVPIGMVASYDFDALRPLLANAAYDLTYGRTTAEPALFCAVFLVCRPEDQQALQRLLRQAALSLTLTRRRVDNEIEPRRGLVARASVRSAHRWLGSDTSLQFNRLQGELAWYTPHGRNSLAARVQLGTVLGRTFSLRGEDVPSFIPPAERLFAGGPNTVRGYRQNLLGPLVYVAEEIRDTVIDGQLYYMADTLRRVQERPTGGNSLVVGNLEYRMRSPVAPNYLQLVVFGDVGQVWNRGEEVDGRRVNLDFDNFRFTPGGGFRVATPIGAIRVDVGYNRNQLPPGAVYHSRTEVGTAQDGSGDEENIPSFFCVSPGNGAAVTTQTVIVRNRAFTVRRQSDEDVSGCPVTYRPAPPGKFWNRLTLNLSIGQAF
jgi:outer membrane protein insertion porin family